MVDENLQAIPMPVKLNLPKLNTIEIPKLKKIEA
jgi:hypothetical protein